MNRGAFLCTVTAWFLFFGGFATEAAIDHGLRIRDGDVTTGGIPEALWFGIPILLGSASAWLAWLGTQSLRVPWWRAAVVSVQLVVGFFIYAAACLGYIVKTGIDSL